jgi:hypothetical protein
VVCGVFFRTMHSHKPWTHGFRLAFPSGFPAFHFPRKYPDLKIPIVFTEPLSKYISLHIYIVEIYGADLAINASGVWGSTVYQVLYRIFIKGGCDGRVYRNLPSSIVDLSIIKTEIRVLVWHRRKAGPSPHTFIVYVTRMQGLEL